VSIAKTFSHLRAQWYGKDIQKDVADAVYIQVGSADLGITWHRQSGRDVVRLDIFEDSWAAFWACPELFAWLGKQHGSNPQPQLVVESLLALGFGDKTARSQPGVPCKWTVAQLNEAWPLSKDRAAEGWLLGIDDHGEVVAEGPDGITVVVEVDGTLIALDRRGNLARAPADIGFAVAGAHFGRRAP
jgi:hypothetical protein